MSWLRVLILLFAVVGIGHASVTAAWKMPIERVAASYADSPPLEKHPGDSAFFQPGDKLWDLSKCLYWRMPEEDRQKQVDPFTTTQAGEVELDWKGEWIVWNSRSGMIVARGSWYDLLVADHVLGFEELPRVVRTRIEVKSAGKPRSLSLISRSGQEAFFEMGGLQAEVEAFPLDNEDFIESKFHVSWPAEGNRGRWEVETLIAMCDGQPCQLARYGVGNERWELIVSGERETIEGMPWKEVRQVEMAGEVKPWASTVNIGKPMLKQLDASRWIGMYPLDVGFVLLDQIRSPGTDIEPSAELAESTKNTLIDIRPYLEERGVRFHDKSHFAGIDPLSRMIVVVADKANQEPVDHLLSTGMYDPPEPPIRVETNPESGGWGVATRNAEAAEIRRSSNDAGNQLLFSIEAIKSADDVTIDFRCTGDVVSGDVKVGQLDMHTTLTKDKPQVVGSGTVPNGEEVKVAVTVSQASEWHR